VPARGTDHEPPSLPPGRALAAGALLAYTMALGWGLAGVWWSLVGLMLTRAATLAWRYRPASGAFG
jgi:Na+-driven multidrug efflux pump